MDRHNITSVVIVIALAAIFAGCSSTSSAPFHMYSSPLLEGEMQTPPAGSGTDQTDGDRPGVESRQVYAYRRWNPEENRPVSGHRIADNGSYNGRTFDTVEAPSEAVLAGYEQHPTGDADTPASASPGELEAVDEPASEQRTDDGEYIQTDDDSGDPAADAAGFIAATLQVNDIDIDDDASQSVPRLYRSCRSEGETYHSSQPHIGDLVFFHNTYDKNDDGRNNDWYTLVGIVEDIHSNGTVDFLAYVDGAVRTLQITPDRLDEHRSPSGDTLNSKLRHQRDDDPPYTRYLAGELFAGFCDIFGDQNELILIDDWAPDNQI